MGGGGVTDTARGLLSPRHRARATGEMKLRMARTHTRPDTNEPALLLFRYHLEPAPTSVSAGRAALTKSLRRANSLHPKRFQRDNAIQYDATVRLYLLSDEGRRV